MCLGEKVKGKGEDARNGGTSRRTQESGSLSLQYTEQFGLKAFNGFSLLLSLIFAVGKLVHHIFSLHNSGSHTRFREIICNL